MEQPNLEFKKNEIESLIKNFREAELEALANLYEVALEQIDKIANPKLKQLFLLLLYLIIDNRDTINFLQNK